MAPGPRKAAAPNQQQQPQLSDDDLPPNTAPPAFPQPVSSAMQQQYQQYHAASSPFAPAAAGAAPFPAAAGGGMLPIISSAASYTVPSSQQLVLQHQQQRPWGAAVLLPGSAATMPAGSMLDASAPAGGAAAAAPFGYTVGGLPLPYGTPGSTELSTAWLHAHAVLMPAPSLRSMPGHAHSISAAWVMDACAGPSPYAPLSTCRIVGAAQARGRLPRAGHTPTRSHTRPHDSCVTPSCCACCFLCVLQTLQWHPMQLQCCTGPAMPTVWLATRRPCRC